MIGIGAGIGAITGGVGAYLGNKAKKKALKAQKKAIKSLKALDPEELTKIAKEGDIAKYRLQFQTQLEDDPIYAALRTRGGSAMLKQLGEDTSGKMAGDVALKDLAEDSALTEDADRSVIKDLITRAKADLDAGATLPPEFQAELVKAGLEGAGTGGLSIEGKGQAGVGIRKLLGSEGLALKERREASAFGSLGAADQLRARRAAALADIATVDNNLRQAKADRTGAAVGVGLGTVPSIGLGGADLTNISMKNTEFENQRKMALAGIKSQQALNSGAMFSEIAGGVMGGAMSGASGGMFGGAGSWLGGLFGSKKSQGQTPAQTNEITSGALWR